LSAKRKNLVLHVRAAVPGPAPAASVTGNRAALEALRDLVDAALEGEPNNASRVLREVDGADYQLGIHLARSRGEMDEPAGLEA
jgi:hypothetical protein